MPVYEYRAYDAHGKLKEGILDATFLYPTGGAEAIDVTLRLLRGEKVEKKIVLGTRVFTRDNVGRGGEEIP